MLKYIRETFCSKCFSWATGPTCGAHGDAIERWSACNANKATPDDIIAAAVIQSFAKDFEHWSGNLSANLPSHRICCNAGSEPDGHVLKNSKKNLTLISKYHKGKSRDNDGLNPFYYHNKGLLVNEIPLQPDAAKRVLRAYQEVKQRVDRVKAVADKAKEDMERNETAWNLAEKLLGMKRNEFGALVPIKTVEG